MRLGCVVASLVLTGACFASHEIDDRPGSTDRPAGADLGVTTRDGGGPADARPSRDGAAPLPRGPVEDTGPDARPSDDPDAADWRDPPSVAEGVSCCEPIGAEERFPMETVPTTYIDLEWNGNGWGLLASGRAIFRFHDLDRDGRPTGASASFDFASPGGTLAWGDGRYGILISREGDGPQENRVALMDRRGVLATPWTDLDPHLDALGARMARVDYRDRWFVVQSYYGPLVALELDARAQVLTRREVAPSALERSQIVGGLKSRAVVFWVTAEATFAGTLTVPLADSDLEPITLSEVVFHDRAATRLRNRAVLVGHVEAGPSTMIGAFDPFTDEVEVHDLGRPLGFVRDAAGMDERGLVAVCSSTANLDDGGEHILLSLLTPAGAMLGEPAYVASDAESGFGPCAVGVDGETIFVAWHRYDHIAVRAFGIVGD